MPRPPEIVVCADADALAQCAAEIFVGVARDAIAERGKFTVALSGGSTPEKLYKLLAAPPFANQVDWQNVFVFWGDERFVPHDDKNSNFGMAQNTLLVHVPLPPANVFAMPTPPLVSDVAEGAGRYVNTLAAFWETGDLATPPVFDLALMGLGDDGHTASLFPGNLSLDTRLNWVVGSQAGVLPPPVPRLTLTLPVFNAARHVLFLAAGARKADVVKDVLENHPTTAVRPAAGIVPANGKLTWLLDMEAAGKLSPETTQNEGNEK